MSHRIVKTQKCISTQPYYQQRVLSNSTPGKTYEVTVIAPGDDPSEYTCTCPGFLYRGTCSHQREVHLCGWTSHAEGQITADICPRCGNETVEEMEYEIT